jgi:hypothetical protein
MRYEQAPMPVINSKLRQGWNRASPPAAPLTEVDSKFPPKQGQGYGLRRAQRVSERVARRPALSRRSRRPPELIQRVYKPVCEWKSRAALSSVVSMSMSMSKCSVR